MDSILQTITRALREHDMAPTTFGRLAVGDPRLVLDLQRGRELRRSTEANITAFLASLAAPMPRPSKLAQLGAFSNVSEIRHRAAMREGSANLLAAILAARGEA